MYDTRPQHIRILELLKKYDTVPLTKILKMKPRIANYSARISELRDQGYLIDCEVKTVKTRHGHESHSQYELLGRVDTDRRLIGKK